MYVYECILKGASDLGKAVIEACAAAKAAGSTFKYLNIYFSNLFLFPILIFYKCLN